MTTEVRPAQFHVLDTLLVFVPVSILLYYIHANAVLTFFVTGVAIIAISRMIIDSVGVIAQRVSTTVAALLNTTFGNAIEFFIAVFALRQGLIDMVKASMVGSIIISVLSLIGLSMFFGGLKYKEQRFNKDSAGVSSTMLIIVVVGLVLPSVYSMVQGKSAPAMSLAVSVVLGIVYLLSLLYTLVTHKHLFLVEREAPSTTTSPRWSLPIAIVILFIAIGLAGFESSLLVNTVTPLIEEIGLTQRFVGVVIIALLGNISEHISAVSFARRNNMTMSLEIGMSSALQIALFVVPILVLVSAPLTGMTLDLVFGPFSLIALVMTAMIANYISADGVCHWLEGAQLFAVYVLIAIAFYFI